MNRMLSTNEAAELLGVSPIRVRQLITAGRVLAQKVGRDYVITESALKGVQTYGKPGRPPLKAEAGARAGKTSRKRISKKGRAN